MVQIDKSAVSGPSSLDFLDPKSPAARETDALKKAFLAGQRSFSFKDIYREKPVKTVLKNLQNGKCCFCEAYAPHIEHGDIEHFRPKGGFQIDETTLLQTPGYYWLAYDFDNLYFCCQVCNQVYKKNFFPLADESKRVVSHLQAHLLQLEEPLIIDPKENASSHIEFVDEIPKAKTERGRLTIKRTGLDRDDLNKDRARWLKTVRKLAELALIANDFSALSLVKEAGHPSQPYSMMIRCNFPELFN